MRTHFLKELSIPGRERVLAVLPDFDFYNLGRLLRLRWESRPLETANDATADFTFTGVYEAAGANGSFEVTFRCEGVTQLKLPEIHPALFVSEIEIEDLKGHGLENANFRIKSYGMTEFEVLTKRLELTDARRTAVPHQRCKESPSRNRPERSQPRAVRPAAKQKPAVKPSRACSLPTTSVCPWRRPSRHAEETRRISLNVSPARRAGRRHARLNTTEIYTHVNIQKLIEVHRLSHPAKLPPPNGKTELEKDPGGE